MSYLELRHVSKSYGEGATEVHAVQDVSLSVEVGTLVAIMGPSGSGKSTLLTIAGGLEDPTSGDVLIDGAPLSRMSRNDKARLRRRTIGYVFQDFNLLAGLTAVENVSLPLEPDGIPARKARAAGMAALDQLGLADRAPHYPDELSGGAPRDQRPPPGRMDRSAVVADRSRHGPGHWDSHLRRQAPCPRCRRYPCGGPFPVAPSRPRRCTARRFPASSRS
jgi:predicted ABC-type transport system involved in lysophospholipase L1 biosynthesis ATPase subunit